MRRVTCVVLTVFCLLWAASRAAEEKAPTAGKAPTSDSSAGKATAGDAAAGKSPSADTAAVRPTGKPVNPNASPEAQKLLALLYEVQGKYTLTAQHNYCAMGSQNTDQIKTLIGKAPMMWGSDFSFAYKGNSPQSFQHCGPINLTPYGQRAGYVDLTPEQAQTAMVETAVRLHKEGHIITLMWHAAPPEAGGDTCDGNDIWTWDRRPTQQQWDELVKDGTEKNLAWKKQADVIAGYFKQLRDAKVPVLWRPFHEMNGVWFWWCNKPGENGFKRLWLMMYDRFVNYHKLDNLLWVWDANAPRDKPGDEARPYENFWPGIDYVDVLAADVYNRDWKQSHHDELVKLGQGKPIALGEVGDLPSPQLLEQQPRWTWFMPWFSQRNAAQLKTLYSDKRVLSQGDVTKDADGNYKIKAGGAN